MIFGMVSGEQGVSAIANFIDIPSVIITIGGSICGTRASNTLPDFINGLSSILLVIKPVNGDVGKTISSIIELSNVARKEGLLALEEAASNLEDEFLKKGIMLVVDGTDPELVRGILETDLTCIETDQCTDHTPGRSKLGPFGPEAYNHAVSGLNTCQIRL